MWQRAESVVGVNFLVWLDVAPVCIDRKRVSLSTRQPTSKLARNATPPTVRGKCLDCICRLCGHSTSFLVLLPISLLSMAIFPALYNLIDCLFALSSPCPLWLLFDCAHLQLCPLVPARAVSPKWCASIDWLQCRHNSPLIRAVISSTYIIVPALIAR